MLYILYALFFISCVLLIGSVLLQPGKTDAGALFTSNVSSTAFAPRGTASVLAKFTIGAAIVFMLSALMISMPALSGNVSVVPGFAEDAPAEALPTPVPPSENPPAADSTSPGEQTITIPADGNANTAAPAANTGNRQAVPIQSDPPSNQ